MPAHGMRVASPVPMMLSDTDQAWLFFLIAGALGACFIWAFWEIEEVRGRRRRIDGTRAARAPARNGRLL
jgi:hypothetical protein